MEIGYYRIDQKKEKADDPGTDKQEPQQQIPKVPRDDPLMPPLHRAAMPRCTLLLRMLLFPRGIALDPRGHFSDYGRDELPLVRQ